ncbi:MAG: site-specific integrase [Gammaproteobacteria bacterium]|nr:site-specific integrase [Gammaproteobacteria bacterium]
MVNKIRFTKAALEALPASIKQYDTYHDDKVSGLCIFVYPTGKKVFYFQKKVAGQKERIKIGSFPETTCEQARTRANEIITAFTKDQNPAAVRRALKAEPTFNDVFTKFLDMKRNRSGKPLAETTQQDYRDVLDKHLSAIKKLKLSQITPDKLKAIHTRIGSPAQANRAKAMVSSLFNWANKEGITDLAAPTTRLGSHMIQSRERFLQPDELEGFFSALESSPLRDFFLLCLLTGARSGNLLAMRWRDLNLIEGVWKIPKTKNGDSQLITLVTDAVSILEQRKAQRVIDAIWVFPGSGKTGHLVAPRKAWYRLLKDAGFNEHLRIHDLRRTLGSYQARQGASLSIIGKSLGHKSLQATQIYARLDLNPVRQSVEQATDEILRLGKKG